MYYIAFDKISGAEMPDQQALHSLGRSLLLSLLESHTGARFGSVGELESALSLTPSGRPYIPGADFDFSISHSGRAAVCVLRPDLPRPPDDDGGFIGVDIERIRPRLRTVRIARRYFSEKDNERLALLTGSPEYFREFTRLWTRAEAVGKCGGEGIFVRRGEDGSETEVYGGTFSLERELADGDGGRYYLAVYESGDTRERL